MDVILQKDWPNRKLYFLKKKSILGQKHFQETLSKLKGRKITEEQMVLLHSGVCARSGKENGMYGRSVYSIWLEKYGKEEADRRKTEMSRKKFEKERMRFNKKTELLLRKETNERTGNVN